MGVPMQSLDHKVVGASTAIDVHYVVDLTSFVPNRYRRAILLDSDSSQVGLSPDHDLLFFPRGTTWREVYDCEVFALNVSE